MTDDRPPDAPADEEDLHRLLAENVLDYAVFVIDGDRKVRTWNPGAERLLGYSEAEILGESADRFFTPEDIAAGQPEKEVRQALATGRGEDDRWHVRKDGTRFWSSGVLTPLRQPDGTLRGFAKLMRDRTDLKREQERSRLRARLLDAVGQAVIATDPGGTVLFWNRAAEALYGRPREEAEGRNVSDLVVAPEAAGEAASVMDRLRAGETWSGEFAVRRPDGTTFPVHVTDAPVFGDDGRLEAIVGVSSDVTDRRRADLALRESESRVRTLADNLPDGAIYRVVQDSGGRNRFTFVSGGVERLFGVTPEAALADPMALYGTIDEQDRDRVLAAEAESLRTLKRFDCEFRHRMPDGEARWVHARSAPRRTPDGGVVWEGVLTDATDRKRAEERLRESDGRYRTLFESIDEGFCLIEVLFDDAGRAEDYRFLEMNPAFERHTGLREAAGRCARELVPDLEPHWFETYGRVAATGESVRFMNEAVPMGGRWFEVNAFRMGRPEDHRVGILFTDISDRRRTEEGLRRSEERFRGLMDQAPFSVQIFSADGRTVRTNRAWEELWGVTADQIGDYNILEDAQLETKGVLPHLRRAFAGEPVRLPEIAYDPNETIPDITRHEQPVRWVSAVAYPIKDAAGHVREVALVHEDVTARRKAEAGLRESEEWLRLALDAGRMGTWEWDVRTGRIRWSEGLEEIHGLAPGSFDGTFETYQALVHPDDLPGLRASIEASLRSRTPYEADFRFVRPDGSVGWMAGRGKPYHDGAGEPVRMVGVGMDVTDRKRAEAAMQESEQRTRSILESITDAFYAVGRDWRFSYLNHEAERLLGRTRDDLVGKHIWEEFAPAVKTDFYPAYHRAMAGTETVRFEVFYPPHEKWYEVHAYPSPDGIAVYFRDIMERRRVEAALRESEGRLRAIFEQTAAGMAHVDPEGRFTLVNARYCEIVGRAAEELYRLRMHDVTHPDDLPGNLDLIVRLLETGQPFRVEKRYVRPDGSAVWVGNSVSGVRDSDGRLTGIVAVSVDLTERKRAEEALRRLAGQFRTLAAASTTINSSLSKESVLQVVTEEARFVIGTHQAVSSLSDNERWAQAINTVSLSDEYAGYRTYSQEPDGSEIYTLVCKSNQPMRLTQAELVSHPAWRNFGGDDGHPPMRGWLAAPLVGRDGRNLGLIQLSDKEDGGDFTAEDEAILVQLAQTASVALENARLYDELRDADRRKDEFLAMLAHELRNPLAPIRSGLDLLKMSDAEPEVVEVMSDQVGHVVRLVDDLLDVSRILRGKVELKKEPTDLSAVLRRAAEAVRPRIDEHRQRLRVSLPVEEVRLDADPVRLTQVVSNLLNNASKYTDDGGEVRLEAESRSREVVVRVSDTGIGIAPDLLPKVFDLFTQADQALDRSQGGLGIGLTVVKSLVEMHGGGVEATSEGLGHGATFTVRLPVSVPAETRGEDVAADAPARSCRILIVDDNAPAAKLLGRLLEKLGDHRILAAHDGRSALEAAAEFRPDLILLDIGLPRMDGYEVARRLRAMPEFRDTLLVALTGYGTPDDRRRSIEAGFDDHVTKPPGVDLLRKVLSHPKLLPPNSPASRP